MEFSLVVFRSRLPCCNGATEGGAQEHNRNRGRGTSMKDTHDPLRQCSDTPLAHGAGERRPRQGCAVKNRSRKQESPQGGERSMPLHHAATHVSCKLESGLSWPYSHTPRRRNKSNCEIFHNKLILFQMSVRAVSPQQNQRVPLSGWPPVQERRFVVGDEAHVIRNCA